MDEIIYSAGSSAARSYPVSLVLSGWYSWESGAAGEQNSASILWSSTTIESEIARLLSIRATTVNPQDSYYLTAGFALRCVRNSYGSTSARSYPVSLVFSGNYYWNIGEYRDQNNYGRYWSSNTNSNIASNSYYLLHVDRTLDPLKYSQKFYGFSLRLRLHFRA